MDRIDALYQEILDRGYAVGALQGKLVFVTLFTAPPTNGLMIALENDGCFVHRDFSKPINSFDLVGAGFDWLSASGVAEIAEALRQKIEMARSEPGNALLIGHQVETKND